LIAVVTSGKEASISDLIGRPQYTAFKANAPLIDIFQVYNDLTAPSADDYLIRRRIIRLKPTFKKNPAAGKPVSYARICLKSQFHRKKFKLTIKPVLVIQKVIVCANGRFNMLCCS